METVSVLRVEERVSVRSERVSVLLPVVVVAVVQVCAVSVVTVTEVAVVTAGVTTVTGGSSGGTAMGG